MHALRWRLTVIATVGLATLDPRLSSAQDLRAYEAQLAQALEKHPNILRLETKKNLFVGKGLKRLSPSLAQFASRKKSLNLDKIEAQLDAIVHGNSIAITLLPSSRRQARRLKAHVKRLGGQVTTQFGGVVLARVPMDKLESLNATPSLSWADLQPRYYPETNLRTSEGPEAAGVRVLHQTGLSGKGVKVGIIDFGYGQYKKLRAKGEVPKPVARQSFRRGGTSHDPHGTACAEIIHDMAPGADIYLAEVSGATDEVIRAAQWLVKQGVHIINFSGGGHGGPHDGRALLDRLVEWAVHENVLWVNAAGNDGMTHWKGQTVDKNNDGQIDVAGAALDAVMFRMNGESGLHLTANWADWGSNPSAPTSSLDLNLAILQAVPGQPGWKLYATSQRPQTGRGAPVELINKENIPAGVYAAVLLVTRPIHRAVPVHLYFRGPIGIVPRSSEGSIAIPATSPAALTVGAVHVDNGLLAGYSSQGPTDDNRVKPDVTGPSNNLSHAYGLAQNNGQLGRFPGTSAASPHVAGFASLLLEKFPGSDVKTLRRKVLDSVRAMGDTAPNNQSGFGHIDGRRLSASQHAPPLESSEDASKDALERGLRTLEQMSDDSDRGEP